jgi:hypothetical protein
MQLFKSKMTIKIFEDNASSLALVNGPRTPARTRHVATRIGFIRDLIKAKIIQVIQCPTADMIADPLTKPLGPIELQRKLKIVMAPDANTIDQQEDGPEPDTDDRRADDANQTQRRYIDTGDHDRCDDDDRTTELEIGVEKVGDCDDDDVTSDGGHSLEGECWDLGTRYRVTGSFP